MQAVEVRARTIPARSLESTHEATSAVFTEAGVDEAALRAWLVANDLALLTSYDVTQRGSAQPAHGVEGTPLRRQGLVYFRTAFGPRRAKRRQCVHCFVGQTD